MVPVALGHRSKGVVHRRSTEILGRILGQLDAGAAEVAWSEMRERLMTFTTPEGWAGPNELLLTAGRRREEPT